MNRYKMNLNMLNSTWQH